VFTKMDVSSLVADHIRGALARRPHHRVGPFLASFDPYSDNPWRNYAAPDSGARPTHTDVEALITLFEQHHRIPRLEYVPADAPHVEDTLTAAGFTVEGRPPVMVSTVDTPLSPHDPSGIALTVATGDDLLYAAATVQHEAYQQEPEPAGPHDVDRLRAAVARGGLVVVAHDTASGVAVGSGLVDRISPHSGTGELAAVGVLAPYRRRGIASAMSAFLARTAHAHGMALVWLEAAPEEEPAYRRTGFPVAGRKLWMSRR
jgi:ribosomal protein S18 acetylase RimI-like enzyme